MWIVMFMLGIAQRREVGSQLCYFTISFIPEDIYSCPLKRHTQVYRFMYTWLCTWLSTMVSILKDGIILLGYFTSVCQLLYVGYLHMLRGEFLGILPNYQFFPRGKVVHHAWHIDGYGFPSHQTERALLIFSLFKGTTALSQQWIYAIDIKAKRQKVINRQSREWELAKRKMKIQWKLQINPFPKRISR